MTDAWMLFDRLAADYDQVVPFFAEFGHRLVDVLDPAPGAAWLDVGSGRGAIAVAAAGRGCAVTAVDAAPRMVALLRAARPDIDARVMDIHRLDLPDNSYDLATGGFVVHLVADPLQALTELRRVLRPGATLALTTPGPCEDHGRWDAFNAVWADFAARTAARARPTPVDVEATLHTAGFRNVRTTALEVHLPVADPQACWNFHMSHGFAARVEALSPADAAEFERRAMAELHRMHERGGIVVDRGATVHLATAPPGAAQDEP